MCTAVVFGRENRYFGRTLDHDVTFGESVVVTPRNAELHFRFMPDIKSHAAYIGTAAVIDGYPLYYEATNEHGLSMAGLNFTGNCHFCDCVLDMRDNVCQFELIPYILGRCRTIAEAQRLIDRINLVREPFSPDLPPAELHWMISDSQQCIVLEITKHGIDVYSDEFGVLTNNPPFDFHVKNTSLYQLLSACDPEAKFCPVLPFDTFSRGMGAFGLAGDWSSPSRFVRAAFVRANAKQRGAGKSSMSGVNQFFHILSSVEMVDGCVAVGDRFEYTQYSCCCDTRTGIYYFKTYSDNCLRAVDMNSCELDGDKLCSFDHRTCPKI